MQRKIIGFFLGIVAFLAIWWVSETVPLAVTALLPIVLSIVVSLLYPGAPEISFTGWMIFALALGFLSSGLGSLNPKP